MFHLYMHLYDHLQQCQLQRERLFKDRLNPFEQYDDVEFRNLFRFTKLHAMELVNTVAPFIENNTGRSHALLPLHQVCIGPRFYATGGF